jgi:hypothetical protein
MADHHDNVITLPGRDGIGQNQQERVEALRATVARLDELHLCLQEFSPRLDWSATRWMIASTSFRMRLTGAHRSLHELTRPRLFSEQDPIHLRYQLNDACRAAAQRMYDIQACLGTLQDAEAPPPERTQRVGLFVSSQSQLLAALREIRCLIVQRFSDVLIER